MDLKKASEQFCELLSIMKKLREPGGCPWDQKQDHHTLRSYLLEETHEALSVIDSNHIDKLPEELGDVLLQIVFHSQIGDETNQFSIHTVLQSIIEKLIRRHPHVFGQLTVKTAEEVVQNWRAIKKQEETISSQSILSDIPPTLPQLLYAVKLQEKASRVGFDWKKTEDVHAKVLEEFQELQTEITDGKNLSAVEEEFGDLMFTLVNLARFLSINPEESLRKANLKFLRRFSAMEKSAGGIERFRKMTFDEMDQLWNRIKSEANDGNP